MPEVGDIVTVILWRGEWLTDARKMHTRMLHDNAPRGLDDVRIAGGTGRWFVVADAVRYQP